jgi:hypothetical protein
MLSILLHWGGGNWLPFLFIMIGFMVIIKGTNVLMRFTKTWLHNKRAKRKGETVTD